MPVQYISVDDLDLTDYIKDIEITPPEVTDYSVDRSQLKDYSLSLKLFLSTRKKDRAKYILGALPYSLQLKLVPYVLYITLRLKK